jgi:predicted DCC family thiol-disulfide oxidoreductase YuxK
MAEMKQLKAYDTADQIQLVDLHANDFSAHYPHIDKTDAMNILHGQLNSGEILQGLDVTCQAWSLVKKHRWLMLLRWPLIKPLADRAYRFFARHRNRISHFLMGNATCNSCTPNKCEVSHKR